MSSPYAETELSADSNHRKSDMHFSVHLKFAGSCFCLARGTEMRLTASHRTSVLCGDERGVWSSRHLTFGTQESEDREKRVHWTDIWHTQNLHLYMSCLHITAPLPTPFLTNPAHLAIHLRGYFSAKHCICTLLWWREI